MVSLAGAVAGSAAGLACRYSGPRWPQAVSRLSAAMAISKQIGRDKLKREFTIRITV